MSTSVRNLRTWTRELFALAGLILVVAGCLLIYPPSALLTSGAVLLYLGVRR